MRLLVWRVVNKTLKFRLTFVIVLTINFPLTVTVKLKPEIISQGDRELIVNMTERRIQVFREMFSEKMCAQQSRKVIWDVINTLFLTL